MNKTIRIVGSKGLMVSIDERVLCDDLEAQRRMQCNDPHHRAAGVDVDFKSRWPPPLRCMRWLHSIVLVY